MGNNASQIDTEGRRNSDGLSKAGSSRFGFRKNRAQPAANGTSDDDNDGSTDRSSFDQVSASELVEKSVSTRLTLLLF